jgi:hypothetical protein
VFVCAGGSVRTYDWALMDIEPCFLSLVGVVVMLALELYVCQAHVHAAKPE